MNKFTVFTIILTVTVVTVLADLLVRDYLGRDGLVSVVDGGGAAATPSAESAGSSESSGTVESTSSAASAGESRPSSGAVESPGTSAGSSNVSSGSSEVIDGIVAVTPSDKVAKIDVPPMPTVTQEIVSMSGFTGVLQEQHFDGKLFRLLDVTNFPVQSIGNYFVEENGSPAVSITEITLRDEIQALQLYSLLQNKTKTYIDLSLNETNTYGDRSFYINHAKKPDQAFLSVKIRNRLYGFAYVKFYHPEVKKVIEYLSA